MVALLMALLLPGCQDEQACENMCASARALYGECLSDWGVQWSAAGYEDGGDFEESCLTWAWEMKHLERDARRRGVAQRGDVDRQCAQRDARLSQQDAACDEITGIDWSRTPWDD